MSSNIEPPMAIYIAMGITLKGTYFHSSCVESALGYQFQLIPLYPIGLKSHGLHKVIVGTHQKRWNQRVSLQIDVCYNHNQVPSSPRSLISCCILVLGDSVVARSGLCSLGRLKASIPSIYDFSIIYTYISKVYVLHAVHR